MSYYIGLTNYNKGIILRVGRVELKVGDSFKCPEGHNARIVWISEDKKVMAVRCPYKHFNKVAKVADHTKPALSSRRHPTEKRKIYAKDMVFLIKI